MKISPHPKIEPGLTLMSGHIWNWDPLFNTKKIQLYRPGLCWGGVTLLTLLLVRLVLGRKNTQKSLCVKFLKIKNYIKKNHIIERIVQ